MKPGGELDSLIHLDVLRLNAATVKDGNTPDPIPHYSTELPAALKVLEAIHGKIGIRGLDWMVEIEGRGSPIVLRAESMPHAICLAALKTIQP